MENEKEKEIILKENDKKRLFVAESLINNLQTKLNVEKLVFGSLKPIHNTLGEDNKPVQEKWEDFMNDNILPQIKGAEEQAFLKDYMAYIDKFINVMKKTYDNNINVLKTINEDYLYTIAKKEEKESGVDSGEKE